VAATLVAALCAVPLPAAAGPFDNDTGAGAVETRSHARAEAILAGLEPLPAKDMRVRAGVGVDSTPRTPTDGIQSAVILWDELKQKKSSGGKPKVQGVRVSITVLHE
jgi:hypothetical protein